MLEAHTTRCELPINLASLIDIASMKLNAVAQRGARRDFWDIHVILSAHPGGLPSLLDAFVRKYPQVDVGHVIRSLVYFGDAESEPNPRGLDAKAWSTIQADLRVRVRAL